MSVAAQWKQKEKEAAAAAAAGKADASTFREKKEAAVRDKSENVAAGRSTVSKALEKSNKPEAPIASLPGQGAAAGKQVFNKTPTARDNAKISQTKDVVDTVPVIDGKNSSQVSHTSKIPIGGKDGSAGPGIRKTFGVGPRKNEPTELSLPKLENKPLETTKGQPPTTQDQKPSPDSPSNGPLGPGRTRGLAGFWANQNDEVKTVKKKRLTAVEENLTPTVVENSPQLLEGVVRAEDPGEWKKPLQMEDGRTRNVVTSFQKRQQEPFTKKTPVSLVESATNQNADSQEAGTPKVKVKDISQRLGRQQIEPTTQVREKILIDRSQVSIVLAENQPDEVDPNVIRSDSTTEDDVVLEKGRTRNLLQHWKNTEVEYNTPKTSTHRFQGAKPAWILEIEAAKGNSPWKNEDEENAEVRVEEQESPVNADQRKDKLDKSEIAEAGKEIETSKIPVKVERDSVDTHQQMLKSLDLPISNKTSPETQSNSCRSEPFLLDDRSQASVAKLQHHQIQDNDTSRPTSSSSTVSYEQEASKDTLHEQKREQSRITENELVSGSLAGEPMSTQQKEDINKFTVQLQSPPEAQNVRVFSEEIVQVPSQGTILDATSLPALQDEDNRKVDSPVPQPLVVELEKEPAGRQVERQASNLIETVCSFHAEENVPEKNDLPAPLVTTSNYPYVNISTEIIRPQPNSPSLVSNESEKDDSYEARVETIPRDVQESPMSEENSLLSLQFNAERDRIIPVQNVDNIALEVVSSSTLAEVTPSRNDFAQVPSKEYQHSDTKTHVLRQYEPVLDTKMSTGFSLHAFETEPLKPIEDRSTRQPEVTELAEAPTESNLLDDDNSKAIREIEQLFAPISSCLTFELDDMFTTPVTTPNADKREPTGASDLWSIEKHFSDVQVGARNSETNAKVPPSLDDIFSVDFASRSDNSCVDNTPCLVPSTPEVESIDGEKFDRVTKEQVKKETVSEKKIENKEIETTKTETSQRSCLVM